MKAHIPGRLDRLEQVIPPDGLSLFERRMLVERTTAPPRHWERLTPKECERLQELGAKCDEQFPGRWVMDELTVDELEKLAHLVTKLDAPNHPMQSGTPHAMRSENAQR